MTDEKKPVYTIREKGSGMTQLCKYGSFWLDIHHYYCPDAAQEICDALNADPKAALLQAVENVRAAHEPAPEPWVDAPEGVEIMVQIADCGTVRIEVANIVTVEPYSGDTARCAITHKGVITLPDESPDEIRQLCRDAIAKEPASPISDTTGDFQPNLLQRVIKLEHEWNCTNESYTSLNMKLHRLEVDIKELKARPSGYRGGIPD